MEDYKQGKRHKKLVEDNKNDDKLDEYFTFACIKYDIEKLTTHEQVFRRGYCVLCNANFNCVTESVAPASQELLIHLRKEHGVSDKWTAEGDVAEGDSKRLKEEIETKLVDIVLLDYIHDFYKLPNRGRKPRGLSYYPERYHCYHCKTTFETKINAMSEHADNHKSCDYTTIYTATTGAFRPREHNYNSYTGKSFQGSDAKFSHHVFPDNGFDYGKLTCRTCSCYSIPYLVDHTAKKKVSAVRRMIAHEKKCKERADKAKK